jgi:hypothetical protein
MSAASLNAARWLFGSAATFNVAAAIALMFLRPSVAPILALDPINGTNIVTVNLVAMFVGLFGYAFALVGFDPVRLVTLARIQASSSRPLHSSAQ